MQEETIHKLMSRYRETGKPDDLGALFDAVAPALFQTAGHLTSDAQAAEDLLQETFLAVIRAVHRWNPKKKASPWLVGILKREAQNRARRERRKPAPERLLAPSEQRPDSNYEESERGHALKSAVAGLPDLYREVIDLVLVNGDSPAEIAVKLGSTPGSIRTRLHRGIAMLKKNLPAGFAVPAALLTIQGTSLGAVRASVLAESSGAKVGTTASLITTKSVAGIVGVALIAAAAFQARSFFDSEDKDALKVAEADQSSQASLIEDAAEDLEARRDGIARGRDAVRNAHGSQAVVDEKPTLVRNRNEGIELRRGNFSIHYKQGYSFATDSVVPKEQADLFFETCAGGISSIRFTSPNHIAAFPQMRFTVEQLKNFRRLRQDFTADCYFRSTLSIDPESVAWKFAADCDARTGHSDVFVIRPKSGGYALCAVSERKSDKGWQENASVIEFIWNPEAPRFDQDRSSNREESGFSLDMTAFDRDLAREEQERQKARQRSALEAAVRELAGSVGDSGDDRPIGVALLDRFARTLTDDRRLAGEYSTFEFAHPQRSASGRRHRNPDFAHQDWNGHLVRTRNVTNDRSRGWMLGQNSIGTWDGEEIAQTKPSPWLKCEDGTLLLIHSLDTRVDQWVEMKVLAVFEGKGIVFTWEIIKDEERIRELQMLIRDPSREMRSPTVSIRMRNGAGGGNPQRMFFDGSTNSRVDEITKTPFETSGQVGIGERSRAWIEGGQIPFDKEWVITRIDYRATTRGDSNGHGEFIVGIKGQKIIAVEEKSEPTQDTWEGEIRLKRGEEVQCFVEIANSSAAEVTISGRFEDRK